MPAGRPTKLEPKHTKKLFEVLRQGATVECASAQAGLHKDTVYDWLAKGRAHQGEEFSEFSDAFELARSVGELSMLKEIRAAGQPYEENRGDWRAVAWILERSYQPAYSLRQRVEHSGPDGAPIQLALSIEDLARLQEQRLMAQKILETATNGAQSDSASSSRV